MTVYSDQFAQVLYNDGEASVHTDFNNSQRFMDSRVLDQVLSRLRYGAHVDAGTTVGFDPDQSEPQAEGESTSFIWTPTGGEAFVYPTGVALEVAVARGTMFHTSASTDPDGLTPRLLPFSILGTIPTFTLAAGDATNPRIDLIEVKIEEIDTASTTTRSFEDGTTRLKTSSSLPKTHYRQATIQVKAGTPAATPAYPSPTAGYAVLGAVYVPATHNAAFTTLHIRNCQIPMGVDVYDIPGPSLIAGGASNPWALSTLPGRLSIEAPAVAGDPLYVFLPRGHQNARVVGVGLLGIFATGTAELVRVDYSSSTPTITSMCSLDSVLCGNSIRMRYANMFSLMANSATGGGESAGARNGVHGDPFWACGHRAGPAIQYLQNNTPPATAFDRLALKITGATTSEVFSVRFVVARGL